MAGVLTIVEIGIEALSLGGLALAIYEFSKANRRPDLRLYINIDGRLVPFSEGMKITTSRQDTYQVSAKLYINNVGRAPARLIQVSIANSEPEQPISRISFGFDEPKAGGSWSELAEGKSTVRIFDGGSDYILYPVQKNEQAKISSSKSLGICNFFVEISPTGNVYDSRFIIKLVLEADNMKQVRQECHVLFLPS